MARPHISDHDLERYYLGMLADGGDLAELIAHLLCCRPCVQRAEETQDYVEAVRRVGGPDSVRVVLPECQLMPRALA